MLLKEGVTSAPIIRPAQLNHYHVPRVFGLPMLNTVTRLFKFAAHDVSNPLHLVQKGSKTRQLVVRQVPESKPGTQLFIAWRSGNRGKALKWFLDRLEDKNFLASLLP